MADKNPKKNVILALVAVVALAAAVLLFFRDSIFAEKPTPVPEAPLPAGTDSSAAQPDAPATPAAPRGGRMRANP